MKRDAKLLTSHLNGRLLLFIASICTVLLLSTSVFAQVYTSAYLSSSQLCELVGPIALYPDPLLANILTASTNPQDVAEAAQYLRSQGGVVTAVPNNDWDPGLQALLAFPDVLYMMEQNIGWTQTLGIAFMTQRNDVLAAVQRCRRNAYEYRNLQSNNYNRVAVDPRYISITPTNPNYIYVPQYYPESVYSYNPDPLSTLITYGLGIAVGNWVNPWGFDWNRQYVYANDPYFRSYYPNYYNQYYRSYGYSTPYVWGPNPRTRTWYRNTIVRRPTPVLRPTVPRVPVIPGRPVTTPLRPGVVTPLRPGVVTPIRPGVRTPIRPGVTRPGQPIITPRVVTTPRPGVIQRTPVTRPVTTPRPSTIRRSTLPVPARTPIATPLQRTPSTIRTPIPVRTVQPRTVQPRTVQPRTTQPRTVQPRTIQPRTVQPRTVQPRTVQPRTVQPRTIRPAQPVFTPRSQPGTRRVITPPPQRPTIRRVQPQTRPRVSPASSPRPLQVTPGKAPTVRQNIRGGAFRSINRGTTTRSYSRRGAESYNRSVKSTAPRSAPVRRDNRGR